MSFVRSVAALAASLAALLASPAAPHAADPADKPPADRPLVRFVDWTPDLFERAAREDKYVLLHMAAVWCHWCHVMERTTYRDPAVLALVDRKYIAVRVDQDSHPELSYRYENWGWPATIMFDSRGEEIFRRQGYLSPPLFARLLQAVIDDPSALPSSTPAVAVDPEATRIAPTDVAKVDAAYRAAYDAANGGFGRTHRFLHGDTVEYALERGRPLKRNADVDLYASMAARTLAGARGLIDPVWGGMYQYSDALDWSSPHFEKILNIQRDALRLYVLSHQIDEDPRDLAAAREVARWLIERMRSPQGAFFASQDADATRDLPGKAFYALDAAARAAGPQPRIDRSLYARENGWVASGLAALYDQTGDVRHLDAAALAVDWALAHRRAPSGAMGHARAADDDASLGDTLAIGEAALALYRSTANRRWLSVAADLAHAIARDFRDPAGGFWVRKPAAHARGALARPVKQIDENVATTRFLNLVQRNLGDPALRPAAEHGLRWLAAVAAEGMIVPGALLADRELAREPAHVTIVGRKDDPAAAALYAEARKYPTRYLRIEWLDRREGPLPNPDVDYPEMPQAAAFACANGACSLPVFDPAEVHAIVRKIDDR